MSQNETCSFGYKSFLFCILSACGAWQKIYGVRAACDGRGRHKLPVLHNKLLLCGGDGYIDERGYLFCQGTLVGTRHGNMRQEFLSSRVHCQESAEMLKEVGNGRCGGSWRSQLIADDHCQAASSGIRARDEAYSDVTICYSRKQVPGADTGWIIGTTD